MRRTIVILLLFLLVFGCVEEKPYASAKTEQLSNSQSFDLDGDGSADYLIYDYEPVSAGDSGMRITRQVTVSVNTEGAFTRIDPNLTDVDLLVSDQDLDSFSKDRIQADTACSANIGLSNVVCSDV